MAAILELRNVDTHYGPVQVHVGVSLTVHEGEITCLLGGNASGSIAVTVPDTAAAADQLEARGVAVNRLPSGMVQVDPAHTLGVRLSLVKG